MRGDPLLAAEVFRRILMLHPGTPEAREAVVYLTEGRRIPEDSAATETNGPAVAGEETGTR